MNTQEKAKILREAGKVQRAHTIPHHGTYSNAEHVHNMLDLLFLLYSGVPSSSLVAAIQFHDVSERWTGDMPGPFKYTNKHIQGDLEGFEHRYLAELNISVLGRLGLNCLTDEETQWLHALDKVELFLWAADQVAMGNQNAEPVFRILNTYFLTGEYYLPLELHTFIDDFVWSRTSDIPPLENE